MTECVKRWGRRFKSGHSHLMRPRVLITGGAAGLGHALCKSFEGDVHSIDVVDPQQPLEHVTYHTVSVCDSALKEVLERVGSVDVLINNAGIMRREGVLDISFEDARLLFDVNVFGVWNVTRHTLLSTDAVVVFVNSRHGMRLEPDPAMYSLTKNMLSLLSEVFSQEGVRVKQAFLGPFEGGVSRHGHSAQGYAMRTLHSAEHVANLMRAFIDSSEGVLEYVEGDHTYSTREY